MTQLDTELYRRHPCPGPFDDRLERLLVLVAVEPEAALGDAAFTLDMRGFEAEKSGARHRQGAVVDHVPGLGAAIDGGILAHRRDDDAVGEREPAQRERAEQSSGHAALPRPRIVARAASSPRRLRAHPSSRVGRLRR